MKSLKSPWILHKLTCMNPAFPVDARAININALKPDVVFMGHMQTVQTKIRHCSINVPTACFQ